MSVNIVDDFENKDGVASEVAIAVIEGSGAIDLTLKDASRFPASGTDANGNPRYITAVGTGKDPHVYDVYTGWTKNGNVLEGCTRKYTSNNGYPANTSVRYGFTAEWADSVNNSLPQPETQIVYVGKHGDDSNDGLTIGKAKLTFGAAITACAGASETSPCAIKCFDSGVYVENLTGISWISVCAKGATLTGNHTIQGNSEYDFGILTASAGIMFTQDSEGDGGVNFGLCSLTNGTNGFLSLGTSDLQIKGDVLKVENGYGVGGLTVGTTHVKINSLEITGTGIGIGAASSGDIHCNVNSIVGSTGSTALMTAGTSKLNAKVAHIDCETAYNVSSTDSEINLICPNLSGSTVETGIANIVESNSTSGLVTAKNANGFLYNQSDSTISFEKTTRLFTISPTGNHFIYLEDGIKYYSEEKTITISDDEGIHVIYFDGESLTEFINPNAGEFDTIIRSKSLVSIIEWNTTTNEDIYFGEERHGSQLDPVAHSYHHFADGLRYLTGLGLTDMLVDEDGSLDTHAQFGIESGDVSDEDIYQAVSTVVSNAGLPIYYLTGAEASPVFNRHYKTGFSVRTFDDTSATRLAYNQLTGGNWQLTEVANNDFVLCHIFATTNITDNMIAFMGQGDYPTRGQARDGAEIEINNLVTNQIIFPEYKAIATVIFQTGSYGNAVNGKIVSTEDGYDFVDWRKRVTSTQSISMSGDNGIDYYVNSQASFDSLVSATPTVTNKSVKIEYFSGGYDVNEDWYLFADNMNYDIDPRCVFNFQGSYTIKSKGGYEYSTTITRMRNVTITPGTPTGKTTFVAGLVDSLASVEGDESNWKMCFMGKTYQVNNATDSTGTTIVDQEINNAVSATNRSPSIVKNMVEGFSMKGKITVLNTGAPVEITGLEYPDMKNAVIDCSGMNYLGTYRIFLSGICGGHFGEVIYSDYEATSASDLSSVFNMSISEARGGKLTCRNNKFESSTVVYGLDTYSGTSINIDIDIQNNTNVGSGTFYGWKSSTYVTSSIVNGWNIDNDSSKTGVFTGWTNNTVIA